MKKLRAIAFAALVGANIVTAQDDLGDIGLQNTYLPEISAGLSFGFNYDLLKSPLDVSFEQPQGFFGFNAPIEWAVNARDLASLMYPQYDKIEEIFNDTAIIKNGEDFKPRAGLRQNPNITVRVDMPMLGGVATFSNIQNFYLNYQTLLGNPNIFFKPDLDSSGISFLLRGTLNVPLDLSMGWETMTFSYAFEFNKWLMVALGLHRHVFSVDLRGSVGADILGRYKVDLSQQTGGGFETVEGELDYRLNGKMYGYYDAAVWSPSLSAKVWRLSLISRFGLTARARGNLVASYDLPFFIDPETFEMKLELDDPKAFSDPDILIGLQTNETNSVTYSTRNDLEWRMPTGLTMQFDVIRDHFTVSYTKLFGETGMKIGPIIKSSSAVQGDSTLPAESDSLVLDIGFPLDHVMLIHAAIYTAYLNLGIFGMDFRSDEQDNVLGGVMPEQVRLGGMAMLPILNLGTVLGTRWQLLFEADLLPLPAVRTGVFYNF